MKNATFLKRLKSQIHQVILFFLWMAVRFKLTYLTRNSVQRNCAILIPADADYLVGSKGDEAMLMAAAGKVSKFEPSTPLTIACTNPLADDIIHSLGMNSLRIWGGFLMPHRFAKHLSNIKPSLGLVMGADIMDGFYSPVTSLRMIIAADLLSRSGARTTFLGFSMNDQPAPLLKYAFRMLDKKVKVNLRDPLSWERYQAFTGLAANLVADTAFLLEPKALSATPAAADAWIKSQKALGKTVLALNFHPMLYPKKTANESVERLTDAMLVAMRSLSKQYNLSWLLLPHDDRADAGDMDTLSKLHKRLNQDEKESVYFIEQPPTAAEIKMLVAGLDGAITGRMHLAIAVLGKSLPIMVFAYQAKFVGLFRHFSLPEWLILNPISATDPDFLTQQVDHFVRELPTLRAQVKDKLPQVMKAAESTFEGVQ